MFFKRIELSQLSPKSVSNPLSRHSCTSILARASASIPTTFTSVFTCSCTCVFASVTRADTSSITCSVTSRRIVFYSFRNHGIAQQSHSTDNRQSLFCSFFEEFSSALSFFFVVFHCLFCLVKSHSARRDWLLINAAKLNNTITGVGKYGVNTIYGLVKTFYPKKWLLSHFILK